MTADLLTALTGLALFITTVIGGWFWYDKKRTDTTINEINKNIKNISQEQIKHANQFVTDPRTRQIVREEIKHIQADVSSTKVNVEDIKKLTQEIVTEIRVVNAVQKALEDRKGGS